MKKHLLAVTLVLVYGTLTAQEDSIRTIEMANVVISENRMQTPFSESARSIHLVTREMIETTPAQSINELLSYVPGVDIRQRGPAGVQADLRIRGGTFEQVLVLINGVKVSDPQTGHHLLNLPLDRNNIERIEVLKGPGARVYGQNAFAGAINIVTKVPEQRSVNAGVYGGDFAGGYGQDVGSWGANAGISLPGENYGQYVSVAHDRSDGYRPNSDSRMTNLFYQSYAKTQLGTLNFLGGHTLRDFGASGFYVENSEEYEETRTSLVSVDLDAEISEWNVRPRLYWRRNHDNYLFVRSNPAAFNNIHTTHVGGAEVNATRINQWGLTGLGIEFRNEYINSNNIRQVRDDTGAVVDTVTGPALGEWNRSILGLFAEHRFYLFDRLDVTPGLYVNWFSDFGWNYFPGLDASYDITREWKLYGNVGRSFRIPTYTDLYYNGPSNVGNDQLEPEKAWTYEGGVKYFGEYVWGQVSYFYRDGSQLIDWVRTSSEQPWQPQNFYNVATDGLEVEVNGRFDNEHFVQAASLSYTYLNANLGQTEGVESRYLLDHLNHQFIASLTHRIWNNVQHSARLRYLDRMTQADYWVLDSRVYYQTGTWDAFVEATNITNTEYTEAGFVQMPGRWLRLGVNVRLQY
ncbi:TonB-dependent receptor plug domain-containing protein [Tunicatimonas pelagia]|uniref:TonB-dependent receptor plug domain-containing protein n=1 Tax=Tunicatimonas pelagia TaxID=931531 RepID=UPI0026653148|nr:TonB-dependent receptor [Tunicatimonas pelagia]WKN44612.1 TonB-dependent receptor [Tunicatimonas pelagia]